MEGATGWNTWSFLVSWENSTIIGVQNMKNFDWLLQYFDSYLAKLFVAYIACKRWQFWHEIKNQIMCDNKLDNQQIFSHKILASVLRKYATSQWPIIVLIPSALIQLPIRVPYLHALLLARNSLESLSVTKLSSETKAQSIIRILPAIEAKDILSISWQFINRALAQSFQM